MDGRRARPATIGVRVKKRADDERDEGLGDHHFPSGKSSAQQQNRADEQQDAAYPQRQARQDMPDHQRAVIHVK